jgi:ribosomal protein S18 acetylase RimI-like enzyme
MGTHEKHTRARIVAANTKERVRRARGLCEEYARSLGFDLDFQDFDEELASFPGSYTPPSGCLLIAEIGDEAIGCVALRRLSDDVCEMKRLYVRPDHRGTKTGRRLAEAVIREARRIGYERMRLDAIRSMTAAVALYRSLGFVEIPQYRVNPIDGAVFFELILHRPSHEAPRRGM